MFVLISVFQFKYMCKINLTSIYLILLNKYMILKIKLVSFVNINCLHISKNNGGARAQAITLHCISKLLNSFWQIHIHHLTDFIQITLADPHSFYQHLPLNLEF